MILFVAPRLIPEKPVPLPAWRDTLTQGERVKGRTMNDNDDPRHDPEGALLQIKALHRRGDLVAAADADDDAREIVRAVNEEHLDLRARYAAQEAAKQAAGRYTLEEAANALERVPGERAEVMLQKLMAAAGSGTLHTFEPGSNARMDYGTGPGRSSRVRDFHEEVFWDDLNHWLTANEKRVQFSFPDPSGAASQSTEHDVLISGVSAPPKPVQRQAAQGAADARAAVTHRVARDLLTPAIDRACSAVLNASDSAAVMVELERLAWLPDKERPAPLAGVTSGGVQWRDGGTMKTLTRKALGDRLRRRALRRAEPR